MTSTDEQQRAVARVALEALHGSDFALAGSGAIREHGITNRETRDIDLFTASQDADQFRVALERLTQALGARGYMVQLARRGATFARLQVTSGEFAVEVDLAPDWRSTAAVVLDVGPVLSLHDAVASKLGALYSRAETRDFLDVDAIRRSGRFDDDELLQLAAERDPGFDRGMFAGQLELVRNVRVQDVVGYGVAGDGLAAVQERLVAWAGELRR